MMTKCDIGLATRMKLVLSVLFLNVILGCSSSSNSDAVKILDLVMPVLEHAELTRIEVVLIVDDTNDPPDTIPKSIVQSLKEAGVVSAVNLTYTWGDPDGLLLIDANVLSFHTAEAARNSVLGNSEGVKKIEGVGDAAVARGNQYFSFAFENTKVSLSTISKDVSLSSVAEKYAAWLAEN